MNIGYYEAGVLLLFSTVFTFDSLWWYFSITQIVKVITTCATIWLETICYTHRHMSFIATTWTPVTLLDQCYFISEIGFKITQYMSSVYYIVCTNVNLHEETCNENCIFTFFCIKYD